MPSEQPGHGVEYDLQTQFEMAMNVFVNSHPESHIEGIMGTLTAYRDFIRNNVRKAGPLSGSQFASWMESAERDPENFPEPWGAELVEVLDGLIVTAAREYQIQPAIIVDELNDWVERTKTELQEIHGLQEGAFDV